MGPLVDTSVLIDYFGGSRTRQADALDRCLAEGLAPAVAPVILQEFLQGFSRSADVARARRYLDDFERVPAPGYETHEQAAALHRALKRAGRTIPTVDSLIVAIAQEHGRALLTRDDHQQRLAAHCGVELI